MFHPALQGPSLPVPHRRALDQCYCNCELVISPTLSVAPINFVAQRIFEIPTKVGQTAQPLMFARALSIWLATMCSSSRLTGPLSPVLVSARVSAACCTKIAGMSCSSCGIAWVVIRRSRVRVKPKRACALSYLDAPLNFAPLPYEALH